jgi:hypothetical protein
VPGLIEQVQKGAEMAAVELTYLTIIKSGLSNCHIILQSDNQGIMGALKNDSL